MDLYNSTFLCDLVTPQQRIKLGNSSLFSSIFFLISAFFSFSCESETQIFESIGCRFLHPSLPYRLHLLLCIRSSPCLLYSSYNFLNLKLESSLTPSMRTWSSAVPSEFPFYGAPSSNSSKLPPDVL